MIESIAQNIVSAAEVQESTKASSPEEPANHQSGNTSTIAQEPITAFLVNLGQIILKHEKQEWLSIDDIYDMSRKHSIRLQGHYPSRDELERLLQDFFKDKEEMYSNNMNVVAHYRRHKWDLLLMLRYYKYSPACTKVNMLPIHDAVLQAQVGLN